MRWSKRAKQSIAIALTFALVFTMNVPLGAWAADEGSSSEAGAEVPTGPTATQAFEALVAALPDAAAVTADHAEAVTAAQAAYDALPEADRALVATSFAKLEAVEAALAALNAPEPLAEDGSGAKGTSSSVGSNAAAWDGTAGTAFAGGDGTADDPFQIADAAQLAYLAETVNGGEAYRGKYFKITADIDLNNKAWAPIGTGSRSPGTEDPSTAYFEGTFDGGGRSIRNLSVEYNIDNHGAGLFGTVKNATIKNVNVVSGSVSNSADSAAGVVAVLLGDSGQVIDCSNGATVTGNSVGGVVARAYATSNTVSGCSNSGAITGTVKAGGVVCINSGTTTVIENCLNTGKVTGGSYGLGGILGYGSGGVTVSVCSNDGTIGGTTCRYAGGIVGYATDGNSKVLNSVNTGAVTASGYTDNTECSGGIVGIITASWGVEGSSNQGTVSGGENAGGIVGSNQNGLLKNCENVGAVSGTFAGGVVGALGTGATIESCAGGAIAATVTGDYAGRLVGAVRNGPKAEFTAFLSIDDANGDSYEDLGTVGIMSSTSEGGGWGYLTVKGGTFRGDPPIGQGNGVLVFPSSSSAWEDEANVAGIWQRNATPNLKWEKKTSYVAETGGMGYATLADAITAAEVGGTVTLLANTTVDAPVEIAAEKDIALDLNGYVLTSGVAIPTVSIKGKLAVKDSSASGQGMIENTKSEENYQGFVAVEVAGGENLSPLFDISSGKIFGTVKVVGNRAYGAERQAYPAKVSVSDRALISVSGKDGSHGPAVALFGSGAQLDMTGGQIVSESYHAAIQGNGTVDAANSIDNGGTLINVSGGTVKGPLAVYHPQSGTMNVTGGTFEGDTGIEMRAGTLDVSGNAVIKGTLEKFASWYDGSGNTTEGAGIAVSQHTTELPIKVSVAGGTISGNKALYEGIVQESGKDSIAPHVTLSVTGGTFNTIGANGVAVESQNCTGFITGGTYSNDVKEYCASTYTTQAKADGSGMYDVVEDYVATVTKSDGTAVGSYTSLNKALSAVRDKYTVTLLKDVPAKSAQYSISNYSFTLDLNGFSIGSTRYCTLSVNKYVSSAVDEPATVLIKNGTIENSYVKSGEENYPSMALYVNQSIDLTLENVKLSAAPQTAGVQSCGLRIGNSVTGEKHNPSVTIVGKDTVISGVDAGISIISSEARGISRLVLEDGVIEGGSFGIAGNGSCDSTKIEIKDGTVRSTSEDGCAIYHPQDGDLTISGGTLEGANGVQFCGAGKLSIEGGSINATADAIDAPNTSATSASILDGAALSLVSRGGEYGAAGSAEISLTGGTLTSANNAAIQEYAGASLVSLIKSLSVGQGEGKTLNVSGAAEKPAVSLSALTGDAAKVITGGTFSSDVTAYVAQGYLAVGNGNGAYVVNPAVAAIGDKEYPTLEDAFAAADIAKAPTEIKLLSNVEVVKSITVTNTNLITLDLNGYAADFSGYATQLLVQGGSLAINDTSTAKTGIIKGNKLSLVSVSNAVLNKGKLSLIDGKIENAKKRAVSLTGSEFVMDGGSIVAPGAGVYFISGDSTFTMNDGAIVVGSEGEGVRITKGVFTMNGGSIESQGRSAVNSIGFSTVTINSGALSASTAVVSVGSNCAAEVLGGTLGATDDSGNTVYLDAATASVIVGKEGGSTNLSLKSIQASKANAIVKLYQGVVVGSLKSTSGPFSSESVFGCYFETDVTDALPAGLACEKQASSGYYTVAPFEQNDPRAVATITSGATTTQWASIKTAALALQDGDTLTLMKDVTRTSEYDTSGLITVKAPNVTIDLNGCKIENGSATIGYGLYVQCPGDSAFALRNSGVAEAVISGPSALFADSSNGKLLEVDLGDNIELVSTNDEHPAVFLVDARIPHNTANEALVTNGGYKAKDANDSKDYIYGSLALAVARSAENDKTAYLLNDCASATSIVASGTAILDLQGHTFTTSATDAIKPGKSETNLTVKNGKVVATSDVLDSAGVGCTDSSIKNFTLTLDGVELTRPNGYYAAYVSGTVSGATLNLLNSTLTTDANSVGVYFAGLVNGKLNIENTSITAGTGIGIKGGTVSISGDKTVVNATGSKFVPSAGLTSGINDTGDAVYLEGNYLTTASVSISGGTFRSANGNAVQMLFNDPEATENAKTISITGGTFSGDPSAYVAAGHSANEQNGEYVVEKIVVAKIAEKPYASLQEAFDAAQDGDTIVLTSDVVIEKDAKGDKVRNAVLYEGGKTFEVDFAGHSVTGNTTNVVFQILGSSESESKVTFKNGVVTAGPDASCTFLAGARSNCKGATVNIDGMTLNNSKQHGNSINALPQAVINVSNTTVNSTNGAGGTQAAGGEINIVDCTYSQGGYYDHNSVNIAASNGGVATVKGGTYKAASYGLYVFNSGGTINVEGGTFESGTAVLKADRITTNPPSVINVLGGSFKGSISIDAESSLTVTGGSFDTVLDKAYYDENIYSQNALDAFDAPGAVVPRAHPVAYDLAGGVLPDGAANPATYTYFDDAFTLANPVKAGYTFAGWTGTGLSGPTTTVTVASKSTGERSYTATWTANTNTAYTVEHHFQNVEGDGYTVDNDKTQTLAGTTDTDTAATALAVTGFTSGAVVQQTIAGDESTVVVIRYDRNVHEVSYAFEGAVPSGASELPAAHQVRYGAPVVAADAATAPGYDFSGWGVVAGLTMPDKNLVLTGSFTARGDTAYKVEHYQQGLDGAYALAATDSLRGETDATATAAPKAYPGFSLNDGAPGTVAQGAIAGDGSLVLKLFYDRNSYQVSYAYTGAVPAGAPAVPDAASVKFGQTVATADAPALAGYAFSGWSRTGSFTMPAENVSITGSWTPRTDTAYTVRHSFQDVEGDGYTVDDAKTQALAGTTGADTAAAPLNVTGFTAQAVVQQAIAADGSTVVEVRYDRNVHTVSYRYRGAVPPGASALPSPAPYRYGAAVAVAPAATAPGHTFAGWSATDQLIMGDADIVLYGAFTARGDTAYKVEHYQQGLEGAYALVATDDLAGETGALATAAPKTYAGFSLNEGAPGAIAQGAIAGDGSLVLKLFYDRNVYQVSYAYTGAVPAGAPAAPAAASVKFGQQVEPAAAPAMTGYAFSGWSRAEAFAMPAENVIVTGSWAPRTDVGYTVRYLLDGTATKLADDKVVEGRTFGGTYTEQAPAIAGYTVKGEPARSITLDAYGKQLVFSYTADEARIVFDSNGGPEVPALVGKTGESVGGSLPTPERPSYAFVGWYAEKSLVNQVTALPATFPAGTTTYVAKWNAVPLPPEETGNVEIQVEVPAPPADGGPHATVNDETVKAAAKHAERALGDLENGEVPTGMSDEDAQDLADLVSGAEKEDVQVVVSLGFQQKSEEEVADGEKGAIDGVASDGETAILYLDLSVKMIVRVEKNGTVEEREVPLDAVEEPLLFEIHVDPALIQGKTVRIAHVHKGKTEIIVPESVDRVRGILRVYAREFSTYALLTSGASVVSFDARGGTAVEPRTVAFGQAVGKPTDPTRAGFAFAGWFVDAACTQAYDFAAPVEQPLTLYAKWTAVDPGPGPSPDPGPGPDPGATPEPEGGGAQGLVPLDTTPKGSDAGRPVGTGDGMGALAASLAGIAALAGACVLAVALRRRRSR